MPKTLHQRRATGRRTTALGVGLLLALSGCSWFGGDDEPVPAQDASPAPVAQPDPDVEVVGSGADDIEVGEGRTAPELGSGAYFVSDLYDLSGPRLEQPVVVRMVLESALPEDTPISVAVRQDETGPWTFVEGRLDAERTHAEFITAELGSFGVLAVDATGISSRLAEVATTAAADDAATPEGVEAAACTGTEAATDEGYAAESWEVRTVGWCLDSVNDERVLRLTNLRGVPVRITAPGATDRGTTGDAAPPRVDWDTWLTALEQGAETGDGTAEGVDRFLAPGQTLAVDADLEAGSSLLVTVADDARARSVQSLHAAAVAVAQQVRALGVVRPGDLVGAEALLSSWLQTPDCTAAIGGRPAALARGCLGEKSLTDSVGPAAALLLPALADDGATRLLRERVRELEAAAEDVEQRLEVTREVEDYGSLVGRFTGTGRSLVVTAEGRVTERLGSADGPVMVVGYQLSDPDTRPRQGMATATVTDVQVLDRRAARGRTPRVGQAGVITLGTDGTVTTPLAGSAYCTAAAVRRCTDAPAASSADQSQESGRPATRPRATPAP